jgi:hypothetical protein
LSPDLLSSYWAIFRGYDLDKFKGAMNEICRTSKFWPKPSEIIDIIEKNRGPVVGIEAQAEQQWRIVFDAVMGGGLERRPVFEDPITALLAGGRVAWGYLCNMKRVDEKWEQKRFCRSYELVAGDPVALQIVGAGNRMKRLTDGLLTEIK